MSKADKKIIRIAILGAGFGGVYVLKYLHKFFHNNPRIKIILVNRKNYFLFTPLLHEVATGGVSPENIVEPLRKVLGCCIGDFYLADALKVNLQNKIVYISNGEVVYDYLVVALGAETNFHNVEGAAQNTFTLKSLDDAIRLKNHFIRQFELASKIGDEKEIEKLLRFVVVGGGPTGVELAAEMSDLFWRTFKNYYRDPKITSRINITLLQKGRELIPQFRKSLRLKSLAVLRKKRVDVRFEIRAVQITPDSIELSDGEVLATKTVIWVAGIQPQKINFEPEVIRDQSSRIIVTPTLQLESYPEVFALGDISAFGSNEVRQLPALAQVATKEAKGVAKNMHRLITNKSTQVFHYKHSGDLISLGRWMAIGDIGGFMIWGRFVWWLWRTIYLFKLISFSKKVKVAVDWTFNLFIPRDISEL